MVGNTLSVAGAGTAGWDLGAAINNGDVMGIITGVAGLASIFPGPLQAGLAINGAVLSTASAINAGSQGKINPSDIGAIASGVLGILAAAAATGLIVATAPEIALAAGIAGVAGVLTGGPLKANFDKFLTDAGAELSAGAQQLRLNWSDLFPIDPSVDPTTSTGFTSAQLFVPRRDPLTLDLNGNGIETVAVNASNPILFDHEGNGIKTGTGWIAPSDGFLVLDRNGNGSIDNGTELFGDSTPLASGGNAADGFAALAQEDTNADGVVNSSDANFANLKVWQDLNQDGISQAGELKTLTELGIASINVVKTHNIQNLTAYSQIADLGSFTWSDGSIGAAALAELAVNDAVFEMRRVG